MADHFAVEVDIGLADHGNIIELLRNRHLFSLSIFDPALCQAAHNMSAIRIKSIAVNLHCSVPHLSLRIMDNFNFTPIGHVECDQTYRFEAPRQGIFADNQGIIRLRHGMNLDVAVRDLAGFDRIWVIAVFHLNPNWKPLVRPPITPDGRKISVLATRSPHRPNPIGLSCVTLAGIDGLNIHIRNFDLLDGTPVLDIKPYLPAADAFPDSATGWLPATPAPFDIEFTPTAEQRNQWLRDRTRLDLHGFARTQLSLDPLNSDRKRLQSGSSADTFIIGCRTWQLHFRVDNEQRQIEVFQVTSAYRDDELCPDADDPYGDKDVHREFRQLFNHAEA